MSDWREWLDAVDKMLEGAGSDVLGLARWASQHGAKLVDGFRVLAEAVEAEERWRVARDRNGARMMDRKDKRHAAALECLRGVDS